MSSLNKTQKRILELALYENITSLRETAERLRISQGLVKLSRMRMYRSMKVHNLAHAVAMTARGDDLILPDLLRLAQVTRGLLPGSRIQRNREMRRRLELKRKLKDSVCRFICDTFVRDGRLTTLENIIQHFEIVPQVAREVARLLEQDGYIEAMPEGFYPLWRP